MELTVAAWRRSSRSASNGGQCVELAATEHAVLVRDSKDPGGPALAFGTAAFQRFLTAIKAT